MASASICREVYPRDRRITSVSSPFLGTRAGFRVSVFACFAGWEMTWSFPTPGTSTVGRSPRAFTCGSWTTSGTRLTPAIGSRSVKNSSSHSASVRSRNLAASVSAMAGRSSGSANCFPDSSGAPMSSHIRSQNFGSTVATESHWPSFVAFPRDGQDARERFEIDVVPREVFVGTVLAVSGEGTIDQFRVPHRETVVVGPEAGHDAGAELLDDDVGPTHEPTEDFLSFGGFQVDGEGTFPSVHHGEGIGNVVDERRDGPHVIAELWVLDLDDVRAEVA